MDPTDAGRPSGKPCEVHQSKRRAWYERFGLTEGDLAFILAGPTKRLLKALDQLRRRLGKDLNLIDQWRFQPFWVVDFPLFAWNEEENRIESESQPFTSPNFDDLDMLEQDPLSVRSLGYDLVLNGYEIASGSQRIHDSRLQEKIFQSLATRKRSRLFALAFSLRL